MIEFEVRPGPRRLPEAGVEGAVADGAFGRVFTDHMIMVDWSAERGWHDARLEPYGALSLPPSTAVFHYGQAVFEGMKAYRQEGGAVALFRPYANADRFALSAARLAMPAMPRDDFVAAVELLVSCDQEWVPRGDGMSLYLRPFMIATDPGLGFTRPSSRYVFCVIASPAAPYFGPAGPHAVTVWLSEDYVRAAPGGTGAAKAAGNYGGAFAASAQATAEGCDQVVWLDAAERRWVEEMGGMNLFFVHGAAGRPRLVSPALTGSLLPGVTRDSLLVLARELGMDVEERRVSVQEWRDGCASGAITETFACGTAAVVAPVGSVRSRSGGWTIADGRPGPVTEQLRRELLAIQYGRAADPFAWVHKVC